MVIAAWAIASIIIFWGSYRLLAGRFRQQSLVAFMKEGHARRIPIALLVARVGICEGTSGLCALGGIFAAVFTGYFGFALFGFAVATASSVIARHKFKRLLHTAAKSGYAMCLSCHYNLHELPTRHTCPECGRPFDKQLVAEAWRYLQSGAKNGRC